MKKILIVNVNWMGDVIFSTPVFRALKEVYPAARISCLAVPRVREILESIPQIDEILMYDEKGKHRNPWAKARLICELRRCHFDAAFLLHRSLTKAFLVFAAGIPQRIGYDTKGRGFLLTHRLEANTVSRRPERSEGLKALKGAAHRCDDYLNIIESFGIPVRDRATFLNVCHESREEIIGVLASHKIAEKDFLVVVHAGGNWDLKRWPEKNFSLLIDRLMTGANVRVIITGTREDMPLADRIASRCQCRPLILAGQVTLKQLIALMKRANLVISADSGPLHIAGSVGTDVIGLFGPTRPEVTGPRGNGRSFILQHDVGCNFKPCYHLECPDNICMQSITVEEVLDVVRQIRNP